MNERTAAILIIGNEVLSGEVDEANVAFLVREFRELGVRLRRVIVCPDDISIIAEDTLSLSKTHDIVVTTGGIGPTHDDVTLDGIAKAFGLPLTRHVKFEKSLKDAYDDQLSEKGFTMADLPEGSELVGVGALAVPVVRVFNVYIFPGIPNLLKSKFKAIRETFRTTPFLVRRVVVSSEESTIAEHVNRIQETHSDVVIGSYPRYFGGRWEVKLTVECKDRARLNEAFDALVSGLPSDAIINVESEAT